MNTNNSKILHKIVITSIVICYLLFVFSNTFASHKVYIIHGYANPKSIMNNIYRDVKKASFVAENYAYPGLYMELDSIGKRLYQDVLKDGVDTVSFVTHSMGGLVVRAMLKYSGMDSNFPKIHRIVMIAPPNRGADIADFFKEAKNIKVLLGPNVEKMQTDSTSYANQLPIPFNTEIGIIVGVRRNERGYNHLIPGNDDGLLAPERVYLGNEKDVAIVNYDHLGVIKRKKSRRLVIEFLQTGIFLSKPVN
jgi:predicted alpha/beta hydrolase family esterase